MRLGFIGLEKMGGRFATGRQRAGLVIEATREDVAAMLAAGPGQRAEVREERGG